MKPSFNTDMQGDVLAVHRGDSNRDELLRYPTKTDVEDFRDGDENGWRTLSRDVVQEHEKNTLDMVQERVSISRDEVGTPRREGDGERSPVTSESDGVNDERNLGERQDEKNMLSKCGKGDEQNASRKNDSSSLDIDAIEDEHDSLRASSEKLVGLCSSGSVEKEDEHEILKQSEPLERVSRDDEQAVLEMDEKVLGFVSRDNDESGPGSPERDDNTLSREIRVLVTEVANGQATADERPHLKVGATEEDTGTCNRCESSDENRVLENDGEDHSSLGHA